MSYRDEVNKVFASPHFDTISQRGFVLEAAARADAEIAKLLTELAEARSLSVDLNAAIKAAWDARNLPASVLGPQLTNRLIDAARKGGKGDKT